MLPGVMRPSLDRTRRLLHRSASAAPERQAAPEPTESTPEFVLSLGRADQERLGGAIQADLGAGAARPDTPARLERALIGVIERRGGRGKPQVLRYPAGLYTQETWQIRLSGGLDPAIQAAIRAGARDGAFPG
jgi:hypothetical protein